MLTVAVAIVEPTGSAAVPAGQITIYRDRHGVPHIEAGSTNALAYGTGYALAFDRPFLTEAVRLTAEGKLAELLGSGQLKADIERRTLPFGVSEREYRLSSRHVLE